jgi:quinol monooxygenase YgiN
LSGAPAPAVLMAEQPGSSRRKVVDAIEIHYHATPFRGERFLELYRPAIARVMAYGADGYVFYRYEADTDHFVHLSYWENRDDFNRYWFSREMQRIREKVAGLHGQPVLPEWDLVIDRR